MRIKRIILLFLLSTVLLLVMLFPVCSIAEIYKWVDEEGVIHFTEFKNRRLRTESEDNSESIPFLLQKAICQKELCF